MTPWEQRIAHEGASRKRRDDYELAIFLAWHVAAFSRTSRLPSWESIRKKVRGEEKKAAPMTADQIKSFFKELKGVVPAGLSEKEQRMLAKRQARAKGKR